MGSITSLTDGSGQLAASYVYDSFGNLTASTGTVTNPFQYTGREFDSETGLYYYRARYYDPNAGRFISEDPIHITGGVNLYAYTLASPVNFQDPRGLAPTAVDCEFQKYQDCVDELTKKLENGIGLAKAVEAGRPEESDFPPIETPEDYIPGAEAFPPPSKSPNQLSADVHGEALLGAFVECLKEHPLAGLHPKFNYISIDDLVDTLAAYTWKDALQDLKDGVTRLFGGDKK